MKSLKEIITSGNNYDGTLDTIEQCIFDIIIHFGDHFLKIEQYWRQHNLIDNIDEYDLYNARLEYIELLNKWEEKNELLVNFQLAKKQLKEMLKEKYYKGFKEINVNAYNNFKNDYYDKKVKTLEEYLKDWDNNDDIYEVYLFLKDEIENKIAFCCEFNKKPSIFIFAQAREHFLYNNKPKEIPGGIVGSYYNAVLKWFEKNGDKDER